MPVKLSSVKNAAPDNYAMTQTEFQDAQDAFTLNYSIGDDHKAPLSLKQSFRWAELGEIGRAHV